MKGLAIALVLGCAAACTAKNEPGARAAPTRPDPGPIPPDSWLINPPNQPPR